MKPLERVQRTRALLACLLLASGLSLLSYQVVQLQSLKRNIPSRNSVASFKLKKVLPARRGLIVDRHDQPLARNRPLAKLVADGRHLRNTVITRKAVLHHYASQAADWTIINDKTREKRLRRLNDKLIGPMSPEQLLREHRLLGADLLSRMLDISKDDILQKISSGRAYVPLLRDIPEAQARRVETALQKHFIQGFSFSRYHKRCYPMPDLAPHIIGFLNFEGIPQAGIEKAMDDVLKGKDGSRTLKRSPRGHVLLTEAANVDPPMFGKHVRLTLDAGLQGIVEEELDRCVDLYQPQKAAIVVLEPFTGDILALGNYPDFDLNLRQNMAQSWSACAWQHSYEAGSVLKIVGMAAVLDQNLAHRGTVVDCGMGILRRPHIKVKDHHRYGHLDFDTVLAKSSNTGTFAFAEMVGPVGFYRYLRKFGFGERSGFALPRETAGYISPGRYPQNFASATYGYGVSVTPLQIAMAYGALANGGNLMEPRLVKTVLTDDNKEIEPYPVKVRRRVISREAAKEMRGSLEVVVQKGTGRRSTVPGYRVGGKTGTSWKWIAATKKKAGHYDMNRKNTTFAGIVPIHKPEFVCVVAIDDPRPLDQEEGVSGGTVAGPVFAKVSARLAARLSIQPTEPIPVNNQALTTSR